MEVETFHLIPRSDMPNSPLPLVLARGAISPEECTADLIAARFRENGWQGTWTYTVFDYWHFHEGGHEVLACCAGAARLGFGGEGGAAAEMMPGDVAIVPAGVGHRRLEASADFTVVGAYPPGQNGAITRAGSGDVVAAAARVSRLALPETDPLSGDRPGVLAAWGIAAG